MRSGLACIAVAFAVAFSSTGRAQTTSSEEEAKKLFFSGIALLQDSEGERVEEAYAQFKRAYELSHSAKILGNLGYCALRLERDGEAIEAYREYLRLVPSIDARERAQIEHDLAVLDGSALVEIEIKGSSPSGVVVRDSRTPVRGSPIVNSYTTDRPTFSLRVRPGHHVVTAVVDGTERGGRWEFDAASATTVRHIFDVTPAPERPPPAPTPPATVAASPSHIGPWLVIGVGLATLAAGGVTSLVTAGKVSDLDDARQPNGHFPNSAAFNADVDSAKSLATVSYVLLAAGGILTAGGVVWRLVDGSSVEPRKTTGSLRFEPSCGATRCQAALVGTF